MKSPVVKRSIVIAGHTTGVSREHAFWNGREEIANARYLLPNVEQDRIQSLSGALQQICL
jgi:predicted DNA-binding ribbon-helix-helix protein